MSLRDSYYNGVTGLQQQMDATFQQGIAYVGAGTEDISTVTFGSLTGSGLAAGAGQPGFYFIFSSPSTKYAAWMSISGEIAPTVAGATLVQISLLSGDNSTAVATKVAAAINAIALTPFSAISVAQAVSIQNNSPGAPIQAITIGTLPVGAAVAQVVPGVNSTGNYSTLNSALLSAAQQGLTEFMVTIQGTGNVNGGYLRQNNGNNLLLKSFFGGISYALAGEKIYGYQCTLSLDVSDRTNTNVIFTFSFSNRSLSYNGGPTSPINGSTIGTVVPTSTPVCYNTNY